MRRERTVCRTAGSPFDDAAEFRLQRMGLLSADGIPDRDALTVLAEVFGGMLFDDFCDFYQSYEEVLAAIQRLLESADGADAKHRFLLICLQYDNIYEPLPDPIWWISGNEPLVELFSEQFLKYLRQLGEKQGEGTESCGVS